MRNRKLVLAFVLAGTVAAACKARRDAAAVKEDGGDATAPCADGALAGCSADDLARLVVADLASLKMALPPAKSGAGLTDAPAGQIKTVEQLQQLITHIKEQIAAAAADHR